MCAFGIENKKIKKFTYISCQLSVITVPTAVIPSPLQNTTKYGSSVVTIFS